MTNFDYVDFYDRLRERYESENRQSDIEREQDADDKEDQATDAQCQQSR